MPNNTVFTIVVSPEIDAKIKEYADLKDVSKAEIVRRALRSYFEILEMPLSGVQEGKE
jgi:predicted transcriptional regulator